ncbi:hypothetical protein [Deinococcus maricopensis]|uniref:Lipoprotein n=1 Tax=Deinococcus maricopensis (strain DSM 21211 / LMG 22137 / NRRL B-23946 / LB-34) TaxID=709986 RepID=E8U6U6_DEIML|nr:hypothetical protein [Deinococcus maricopensis]ADV66785.1 hypothetical protein Deima_1133 [Deinococcus maricopensis DSM 21211]
MKLHHLLFGTTCALALAACSPQEGGTKPPTPGNGSTTINGLFVCTSGNTDPRCAAPDTQKAGAIGKGAPIWQGGLYDRIIGGQLVGDTLYAAVEYGGRSAESPETNNQLGAIVGINVKTGDRTLLAGQDVLGNKKGSGHGLNGIRDVKVLPDGNFLVIVDVSSTDPTYLIKVNATTGDRTVVWTSRPNQPDSPITSGEDTCPSNAGPTSSAYTKLDWKLGVDGNAAYLTFSESPAGSGFGIAKVNLSTAKCSIVTRYLINGESTVGSGDVIPQNTGSLAGLFLSGGKAYVNSFPNDGLMEVDLQSGARRLIAARASSGKYPSRGSGEDVDHGAMLKFGQDFMISNASASESYAKLQRVTPAGVRSAVNLVSGPASRNIQSVDQPIFTDGQLIYMGFDHALLAIDPSNGNSNIISQ